jgi:hypothetical protein
VIVDEFYDAAVAGAVPVQECSGFAALLQRTEAMEALPLSCRLPTVLLRDLIIQ